MKMIFYKQLLFRIKILKSLLGRYIYPIRGRKNKVVNKAFSKKLEYNINGNHNFILFTNNCTLIKVKIYIRGNNNKIIVHENCLINNSVFWIENDNCLLEIGNKTTIEGAHFGIAENGKKIVLGEDCMLSENIYITTTDSHSIIDLESQKRINPAKDVIIGNHAWIGKGVTILKGTTIGENVIVGAMSLVNKDLESNCIYAGIPVKKIKEKINWKRERIT